MVYSLNSKMKKWEIRDYGNGIYEIVIATWVNTYKPHYIEAIAELAKAQYILNVRQMGMLQQHFIVTTMPKALVEK
jgi:hypothetical protein